MAASAHTAHNPQLGCSCCGPGLGLISLLTHLAMWFAYTVCVVICLSKLWCVASVAFVDMSGFGWAHGALHHIVLWASRRDVVYVTWSSHSSSYKKTPIFIYLYVCTEIHIHVWILLKSIYLSIYMICTFMEVEPTQNILWKVEILIGFEMYSVITEGQVSSSLSLMTSPGVKWYKRLVGNFQSHILLRG